MMSLTPSHLQSVPLSTYCHGYQASWTLQQRPLLRPSWLSVSTVIKLVAGLTCVCAPRRRQLIAARICSTSTCWRGTVLRTGRFRANSTAMTASETKISSVAEQTVPDASILPDEFHQFVAVARRRPCNSNRTRLIIRSEPTESGDWHCTCCNSFKPLTCFHRKRESRNGHSTQCKSCRLCYFASVRVTLRGALRCLKLNAQSRSKKECSLSLNDLIDIYEGQDGRCAYSNVLLCLQPNTEFAMSLERIDNFKGYSRENCVLIAVEFNSTDHSMSARNSLDVKGSAKWSKEKFETVLALRAQSIDFNSLSACVLKAVDKPEVQRGLRRMAMRTCEGEKWCSRCCTSQPVSHFHLNRSRSDGLQPSCKHCKQEMHDAYTSTLRGSVMHRLRCCASRKALQPEQIFDMILRQKGRCYYSGVPLDFFQPNSDWRWSMERLDTNLGYTRGNTVLVADEFNVFSRNKAAQWSRAKAIFFWGPFPHPDSSLSP